MNFNIAKRSILASAWLALALSGACAPGFDLAVDEQRLEAALKMPREDILKDKLLVKKISATKIYISLTTSPKRIKHLDLVLRSLDLSLIERVVLILPSKFGRNNEPYEIPDHILHFPKLAIIRTLQDRGPISKLLGAIELDNIYEGLDIAKEIVRRPEHIVITIDDDIAYPFGMISQLIKAKMKHKGVFGGSGISLSFWGIDKSTKWPERPSASVQVEVDATASDVVEGFGGIIYSVADILESMDTMLRQGNNLACLLSDDIVISYALEKHQIQRYSVVNEFITRPLPYTFGLQEDALHKAAGMGPNSVADDNVSKYQECFQALH